MNSQRRRESNPVFGGGTAQPARMLVLIQYAPCVFDSTVSADRIRDVVEFFQKQAPGCEAGEIALLGRNERRVLGSVKWEVQPTENGLRVPYRPNLFCGWNTALVALAMKRGEPSACGALI